MTESSYILSESTFIKKLNMVGLAAAAIGIVLSIIAATSDWNRFIHNYLVAFVFFGGIAVTGIFFSMLQYLVRAGWSVAVRRIPEMMAAFVPFLILLAIPIFIGVGDLYHHWVHPEEGDAILQGKAAWLNVPFFIARIGIYYLIWLGLYYFIVGNSFRQDKTKDPKATKRNWTFSAPATILYAISITFAAFDLLMSLYPHWYSTIFGVYFFSGSFVGALAVIVIIAILLHRAGLLSEWLTNDVFHELGKLLFAFNVFWAYIAFSQYMLIWYGNLPEETIFFKYRMEHGWEYVSLAILFVHFIIPFTLLISESSKRNLNVLLSGAVMLLIAHFIDMYWLVMPYFSHEAVPMGWIEIAPSLALGGLFILIMAWRFKTKSAIPINDPFLPEAKGH
jgi:hypothetical protein